jgi:hypothetical protein
VEKYKTRNSIRPTQETEITLKEEITKVDAGD